MSTYQEILLTLLFVDVSILLAIFKTRFHVFVFYVMACYLCCYIVWKGKIPKCIEDLLKEG